MEILNWLQQALDQGHRSHIDQNISSYLAGWQEVAEVMMFVRTICGFILLFYYGGVGVGCVWVCVKTTTKKTQTHVCCLFLCPNTHLHLSNVMQRTLMQSIMHAICVLLCHWLSPHLIYLLNLEGG